MRAVRDNKWYLDNMGNADDMRTEARSLRAQAAALIERANDLESDISALSAPDEFVIFEGQVIRYTVSDTYDGRTFHRLQSLPFERMGQVYMTAGERDLGWAASIEAIDFLDDNPHGYDRRLFSGGILLGFRLDEQQALETVKRWVAFGQIPTLH